MLWVSHDIANQAQKPIVGPGNREAGAA